MADYSNPRCEGCPYHNASHLRGKEYEGMRAKPLSRECGAHSTTMLVLQSPGANEWKLGKPLLPTKIPRGATAGTRILQSWERKGLKRKQFIITNAVQCYQGKKHLNGRDKKLSVVAVRHCQEWLEQDIRDKHPSRIICFGAVAIRQVTAALESRKQQDKKFEAPPVTPLKHPSGGLSNEELDNVWGQLE